MRRQVAATALATAGLGFLIAQGMTAPIWLLLGVSALVCYVLIASGRILLRVLDASDLPIAAAWSLGVTATSLVLYASLMLLPLTALWGFACWAALVVTTDLVIGRRGKPEPAVDRVDLVGFALCVAVTVVWCRHTAAAPTVLEQQGFLPAWLDYFLHGGTISQFGDPRAADGSSIWLTGFPTHFYHYASYMIPASLAVPLDQPGLPLATSVWLPLGFLSLAAAAYALGSSLAGPAGGVAALAGLFLLPDASNYGLRNGIFGFHWNLLTLPGSTFALGSALLAAVFLHRWTATRMKTAIVASALLVAATFSLRVHVFLLLLPAWVLAVAVASQWAQRKPRIAWAVAALCALAAAATYRLGAEIPSHGWWQDGPALERFLYYVHRFQAPPAYYDLYRAIASAGKGIEFTAGVLLVFPACLGAFAFLYPIAIFLERERIQLRGADAFPLLLFASYVALMVFAPAPNEDSTELTQRPFVLLYAVVVTWTAALSVRWLSAQGEHRPMRIWQTLLIGSAFALPVIWLGAAEMARTKPAWANRISPLHVKRGLLEIAAVVRARSRPGDTMATLSPTAKWAAASDSSTVLASLTATPLLVAHPLFYSFEGGPRWELATRRNAALKKIARERDAEVALGLLRALGLRWYVVTEPGAPLWDPARTKAVHVSGDVALYEIVR
jgi:hypothetical protein